MVIIGIKRIDKKTILFGIEGIMLCRTFHTLSQTELYAFLRALDCTIDAAVISFHQPYRNTLYALFPNIKIAIFKNEVMGLFNETLEDELSGCDEIAASTDEPWDRELNDWLKSFITDFYKSPNKNQALACYEAWQAYIPLNNKRIYRLVRIMEFYNEEVLNYFDMRTVFENSKARWI